MEKICVIGLGYIGLPTASLFANNGFMVLGIDSDSKVVETINAGNIHIEETGLRTLVEAGVKSEHLRASVTPESADVFIIAVPTPFGSRKEADLSYVFSAIDAISSILIPGNLLVLESTISPGATRKVAERITGCRPDLVGNKADPIGSMMISVAHCPERVLPGRILAELVGNDRVIGGLTKQASGQAAKLYGNIVSGKIYQTDATTAEMVKLSENTFRDVNISLANELALICEKLGINVWEVIELANRHPRVRILSPGPGVGGHCIAVDPWFIASEFPEEAKVIHAARIRNDSMPGKVIEVIFRLVKGLENPKIACLGASYKSNVGDARNSPALEIYQQLAEKDGKSLQVVLHDNHIDKSRFSTQSLENAVKDASLIVVLVDHKEYLSLDPVTIGKMVSRKCILDTRNILNHHHWRSSGFEVHVLGNGQSKEVVSIS
jgi:UDP-N-acetyl-D-mannosaminuronic acid dehydrogenase